MSICLVCDESLFSGSTVIFFKKQKAQFKAKTILLKYSFMKKFLGLLFEKNCPNAAITFQKILLGFFSQLRHLRKTETVYYIRA